LLTDMVVLGTTMVGKHSQMFSDKVTDEMGEMWTLAVG